MKMINVSIKAVNKVQFFKFSNLIYSDINIFQIQTFYPNGCCDIWHAEHVIDSCYLILDAHMLSWRLELFYKITMQCYLFLIIDWFELLIECLNA